MQKSTVLFLAIIALIAINCGSKKKTTTETEVKEPKTVAKAKVISYVTDIAPILKPSCSPCHFTADGGKKEPLDSYAAVKDQIRAIIGRVKLPKDSRGYMPFQSKKPALSDSAIKVLETWQNAGMAE